MAYLDINHMPVRPRAKAQSFTTMTLPDIPFSALEQSVIQIATKDPASSLITESWGARRLRSMFGIVRVLPLANARLEALRRVVVSLRYCAAGQIAHEIAAAHAFGITAAQTDTLRVQLGRAEPSVDVDS
jgi:hypothetical protein